MSYTEPTGKKLSLVLAM